MPATTGWKRRSRSNTWLFAEKSRAIAPARVAAGKIVSPRAANEPVMPVDIMQNNPIATAIRSVRFADSVKRLPPVGSHFAVSASAATSSSVFPKCRHKNPARLADRSMPTCSKRTSIAPRIASFSKSIAAEMAEYRGQSPLVVRRQVQTRRTTMSTSDKPLVSRCVNSIKVLDWTDVGRISPLHRGQWLPQPAPDPVARTKAPHRITVML